MKITYYDDRCSNKGKRSTLLFLSVVRGENSKTDVFRVRKVRPFQLALRAARIYCGSAGRVEIAFGGQKIRQFMGGRLTFAKGIDDVRERPLCESPFVRGRIDFGASRRTEDRRRKTRRRIRRKKIRTERFEPRGYCSSRRCAVRRKSNRISPRKKLRFGLRRSGRARRRWKNRHFFFPFPNCWTVTDRIQREKYRKQSIVRRGLVAGRIKKNK